jgi:hypothetical protein
MVSFVWSYFIKSKDNLTAKCDKCKTNVKIKGISTTSLITHLENMESEKKAVKIQRINLIMNHLKKRLKQSKLSFINVKPSRTQILSEMVAKDGITIN